MSLGLTDVASCYFLGGVPFCGGRTPLVLSKLSFKSFKYLLPSLFSPLALLKKERPRYSPIPNITSGRSVSDIDFTFSVFVPPAFGFGASEYPLRNICLLLNIFDVALGNSMMISLETLRQSTRGGCE